VSVRLGGIAELAEFIRIEIFGMKSDPAGLLFSGLLTGDRHYAALIAGQGLAKIKKP